MVENNSSLEGSDTCWYLFAAWITREDTLSLKGTSPWKVNPHGSIPDIPLLGGIEGGNIVKACVCLGFWQKSMLYDQLKKTIGDQGFGLTDKGSFYWGWKLTKECEPCGRRISGRWNKDCPCEDRKSIRLNNINSDSTSYVASDGTSIVFSDPGNFESVMKEIVAKEESIPLKCEGKNPSQK